MQGAQARVLVRATPHARLPHAHERIAVDLRSIHPRFHTRVRTPISRALHAVADKASLPPDKSAQLRFPL